MRWVTIPCAALLCLAIAASAGAEAGRPGQPLGVRSDTPAGRVDGGSPARSASADPPADSAYAAASPDDARGDVRVFPPEALGDVRAFPADALRDAPASPPENRADVPASRAEALGDLPASPGEFPADITDPPPRSPGARADGQCAPRPGITILVSPAQPAPGKPLRVLAVSETAIEAMLVVGDETGERVARDDQRHGGPPYWWSVELLTFEPGHFRATLEIVAGAACTYFDVEGRDEPEGPQPPLPVFWPVERQWDRGYENLYSAWVEKLFDARLDEQPTWRSLHQVTRDTARNLLHDHLGLGEDDEGGLALLPDCADLPFFLRGYFAWKLRLPFAYSTCFSVAPGKPPTCSQRHTNLDAAPRGEELQRMQRFFSREVAWTVHSATVRTSADDQDGDLYPTNLSPAALRPGTVFADPYGHVLIVARRVEQVKYASGLLLAVDAQPDKTVARKQYWRGNFLFAIDPALGAAGFKHFRPIVFSEDGVRALSNEEILVHRDYGDYSFEQYASGVEGFYERVDEVLSPEPRAVEQVFGDLIEALDQQVRGRLLSVSNGEEYMASHPAVVAMPEGAALFQTVGAWEDYSTPARDLRLLIAIDVVRGFPAQVLRRPERYRLRPGTEAADLERDLRAMLESETAARTFEYKRSDGSMWTLSLADVLQREIALEMGYNPNDCVEVRWGAAEDSEEMSTCRRYAPAEQRGRMEDQRHWFHDRKRPST